MGDTTHVYVSLERDEHGYPPYEIEELDASLVSGDLYRIEGIPAFVHGLARGEIVRVVRVVGDDRLWVQESVQPSAHWTTRVLPWDRGALEEVASEFRSHGCDAQVTPFGLVAVDVPPSIPAARVMTALREGFEARRWDFDIGVPPPPGQGPDQE